jgi:hypothetical protein
LNRSGNPAWIGRNHYFDPDERARKCADDGAGSHLLRIVVNSLFGD